MRICACGSGRGHTTTMGISPGRVGILNQAHYHPLVVLVLHSIVKGRSHSASLALGCDRHERIGLLTVIGNLGYCDIHPGDIKVGFGKVIDHTLPHRIGVVLAAALAGG